MARTTMSVPAGSPAHSVATARAIKASKDQWLEDLKTLLVDAKRRFADISWKVDGDDGEVYYGHRAILYGRGTGAFQMKYLSPNGGARLQAIMSMSGSGLELPLARGHSQQQGDRALSPGALSFESARSGMKSPITLQATEASFFKALLEFMYTANTDIKDVFSFLFDDGAFSQTREEAIDRLSQDLLFVWRSKLFADTQLQITELAADIPTASSDDLHDHEESLFSTHRAILSARCPYFSSMLLNPYTDVESTLLTLPSPPFTPAALHFTLAYIYTGSLTLNRQFDMTAAMDIWRAAQYLNMDLMRDEIDCRIRDMCHDFKGCCKSCRGRACRVFVFSTEPDVNSLSLQQASRPVLLTHFGELWERSVGELPYDVQKELIVDLCQQTTAYSASSAMKGICQIRNRITMEHAPWAEHLRSMLLPLEDRIKHFLRTSFAEMATSQSFVDLLEGIGFSNDVLEILLEMLVGSLTERNAPGVYEILVGKVMLREEGIRMDARARVEDARQKIILYIKKRWVNIRMNDSFGKLQNWALKELSDEIEQPVEELLQSTAGPAPLTTRTGLRLANTKVHKVEREDYSMVSAPDSLRASVLNRNAARKSTGSTMTVRTPTTPGAASTSASRSTFSTSGSGVRPRVVSAGRHSAALGPTPGSSRMTSAAPAVPTAAPTDADLATRGEASAVAAGPQSSPRPVRQPPAVPAATTRPKSSSSIRSSASTSISKVTQPPLPSSSRTPARPASVKSVRSGSETAARLRTASTATESSPSRRPAARGASVTSTRSRVASASSVVSKTAPPPSKTPTPTKAPGPSPAARKPQARPASVASTSPSTARRPASVASAASTRTTGTVGSTPSGSTLTTKSPGRLNQEKKVPPLPKGKASLSPPRIVLPAKEAEAKAPGSALNVGIPCVVTDGPVKFKATVRYLGEVLFDTGTYVGVEVPVNAEDEGQAARNLKWHDGSVDGVRYFELESQKPKSPLLTELQAKAERRSSNQPRSGRATPLPEDPPGPSRGLFVQPSQVLFVF